MNSIDFVPIGECVSKIKTWDPRKSESDDTFLYIDLSSVDKNTKMLEKVVNTRILKKKKFVNSSS